MALTTFHSAYLNPQYASRADAIHAFMLTKIARDLYAHQRRQYAGGLVKYEPNDLNRAQVADFSRLNANTEKAVLQAYSAYRSSQLRDEPGAEHLQRLEDIFFTFLGG